MKINITHSDGLNSMQLIGDFTKHSMISISDLSPSVSTSLQTTMYQGFHRDAYYSLSISENMDAQYSNTFTSISNTAFFFFHFLCKDNKLQELKNWMQFYYPNLS